MAQRPRSSLGFRTSSAFLSAFDKGDRGCHCKPWISGLFQQMMALGITPQLLPARAKQNWKPDLEALVASDDIPDGLLLASPPTPTGVVMSDDELEAVCSWCDRHAVRLIMDEIYHGLTFERARAQSAVKPLPIMQSSSIPFPNISV